MIRFFKSFYLTNRFFIIIGILVFLFALSFPVPYLLIPTQGALFFLVVMLIVDSIYLYRFKTIVLSERNLPNVLSLSDENEVEIRLENKAIYKLSYSVIDEVPEQLQWRDMKLKGTINPGQKLKLKYKVAPKNRGLYEFNDINIYLTTTLKLAERRVIVPQNRKIPVYPSIIQMKKYEIRAITSISHFQGIKKIRKIGHSYEFEQIKPYVRGDDPRSINWKASSRVADIMVNQYEDERSQPVYTIIDKSRAMKMPFNGLSLLDYAINTSLVISNIVLKKHDKAGLLTFSNRLGSILKAEKSNIQLQKIIQALYNEKQGTYESDYELLYSAIRNFIRGRSLLFLYTNFESVYALERVLPILRKINRLHLLVVIFFNNTELEEYSHKQCENFLEIYQQTAARQFINYKDLVLQELHRHGIQVIKTNPDDLSINSINKYLELKSRGYI